MCTPGSYGNPPATQHAPEGRRVQPRRLRQQQRQLPLQRTQRGQSSRRLYLCSRGERQRRRLLQRASSGGQQHCLAGCAVLWSSRMHAQALHGCGWVAQMEATPAAGSRASSSGVLSYC